MTETNQALVVQQQSPQAQALIPRTWQETWSLAQAVAKCSLVPHLKNPDDAYIILLQGLELGLTPMQSVRAIYVVDGKPCMSAELMMALCLQHKSVCQYFALVSSTEKEATYESKRIGTSSPIRMTYTIEQANRAGLTGKKNWTMSPEDMLRRRAASKLARALYPDILMGFSEITEIDEVKDAEVKAPIAPIEIKTASAPDKKLRELTPEQSARFESAAASPPIEETPKVVDDIPADFGADVATEVTSPAEPFESEALTFLKGLIATSIDQESLTETAKQIQKSQAAHRLTDLEVKTLRGLYATRKMELEAQARTETGA